MSSEIVNIELEIAGRKYPLRLKASEVENISAIAQKVNAGIKDLIQQYHGKDMQDFLAMYILLMITQNNFEPQSKSISNEKEIAHKIDDLLSKINAIQL